MLKWSSSWRSCDTVLLSEAHRSPAARTASGPATGQGIAALVYVCTKLSRALFGNPLLSCPAQSSTGDSPLAEPCGRPGRRVALTPAIARAKCTRLARKAVPLTLNTLLCFRSRAYRIAPRSIASCESHRTAPGRVSYVRSSLTGVVQPPKRCAELSGAQHPYEPGSRDSP